MGNIIELEKEFVKYSEERAVFLENADSKKANKTSDKIFKVIKELKTFGAPGIKTLRKLMEHDNTWVAVNAAGALRKELPDEAKKTMKKIADHSLGIPAAEANIALTVWKFEDGENNQI